LQRGIEGDLKVIFLLMVDERRRIMVKCFKEIAGKSTKRLVKILHIDKDYQAFYFLIRNGARIISEVSLAKAIEFLKTSHFDLVLFEPKNLAILTPQQREELVALLPA
jgi:hypothetical protein